MKSEAVAPDLIRPFVNTPVLLDPRALRTILTTFRGSVSPRAIFGERHEKPKRYAVVNGIAVIGIEGVLYQRGISYWYESYESVRSDLAEALGDPAVRAVLLDIASPGGEIAGCFDLADWIRSQRGAKPIWAVANESAFSAAYCLASACDYIVLPRSAGVGSVGVIAVHVDWSGWNEQMGLVFTAIYSGARKNDASPDEPLSDTARATWQDEVDRLRGIFATTVAAGRLMAVDAVLSTEAATYYGEAAIEIGFADAVMTRDEAMVALAAEIEKADERRLRTSAKRWSRPLAAHSLEDPKMSKPEITPEQTPTPAPAAQVVDLDAERRRIRGEVEAESRAQRTLQKQIAEMCKLSGLPELAASLPFEDGITLEAAQKKLTDAKAASANNDPIDPSVDAARRGADAQAPEINVSAIYRKWNGGK